MLRLKFLRRKSLLFNRRLFYLKRKLGVFSPKYENGNLVEAKIVIHVNSIISSAERFYNENGSFFKTMNHINQVIDTTCAHEFGHLLQVYKFDNYYERFVTITSGRKILFDDSILSNKSVKTLVEEESFLKTTTKMAKGIMYLECDADRFAKEFLLNKGYDEVPTSLITDYKPADVRWYFANAYVAPKIEAYLERIANKVYKESVSSVELTELAFELAYKSCGFKKKESSTNVAA